MVEQSDTFLKIKHLVQERKVVPFIGAGISQFAPTNLPLANTYVDILFRLLLDIKLPGFNLSSKHKKSVRSQIGKRVRFELLMQQVRNITGKFSMVNSSLSFYAESPANRLHELLLRRFPIIVTPNFDLAFENVARKRIPLKVSDFNVEGESLSLLRLRTRSCKLFKLHGTINKDESLQVTLRQCAAPLYGEKANVLKDLMNQYHLLFIGYSGRDDDIVPFLRQEEPKKKPPFWIYYDDKDKERVRNLVKGIHEDGEILEYDMRKFIPLILKEKPENMDEGKGQWDKNLYEWVKMLDQENAPLIIAETLRQVTAYSSAIGILEKFVRCPQFQKKKALAYYFLGSTYQDADSDKAGPCYKKANETLDSRDSLMSVKILRKIGNVEEEAEEQGIERAKTLYKRALYVLQRMTQNKSDIDRDDIIVEKLEVLRNLGEIYDKLGKKRKALWYLSYVINQFKNVSGDPHCLASALGSRGIIYRSQRNYNRAQDDFKQQERVLTNLGDEQLKVEATRFLCEVDMFQPHPVEHKLIKEILPAAKRYKTWFDLASAYEDLGQVYMIEKKFIKAKQAILKGIRVITKHCKGDPNYTVTYCRLAECEIELGNLREAKRRLKQAWRLAGKNYPEGLAQAYLTQARISISEGYIKEARRLANKSKMIAQKIRDLEIVEETEIFLTNIRGRHYSRNKMGNK